MGIETDLNVPPFFDDFSEDKNFHRVLFRPETAVQARELTGLQSILQNQIERFGNHTFKDGSIVDGVAITYYSSVHYLSLEDSFNTNSTLAVSDLDNSYLITNSSNSNNAVRAVIKIAKDGIKENYPDTNRIYFDYVSTGTDGSNNDVNIFVPGDTLYFYSNVQSKFGTLDANNLVDSINTLSSNGSFTANGYAYCVGVSDGLIFQKGVFQKVDPQVITIRDYSTNVTSYLVGFDTTESIVTELDDESLYDNSLGYPNENAPGAHRLKLTPTLVAKTRTETANNKNFFAIVEFDGQSPTEQKDDAEYNVFGQQLANRTYEESGDYVVKPFQIETRVNDANTQTFYYEVSPGVAYVRGNRVEKIGPTKLEVIRATTTEVVQNQIVTGNYGNYVICDEYLGAFDFEQLSEVSLYNAHQNAISEIEGITSAASGTLVGKANVRAVVFEDGTKGNPEATFLVYLFNIRLEPGYSFTDDMKSLYMDGTFGKAKADIVLENEKAILKESAKNSLVFDTGLSATKRLTNNSGIGDTSYVYNQIKTATLANTGATVVNIDTAASGGTERLNATTGSTLTGALLEGYNVLLSANAYSANLTGTIALNSGNSTVTGTTTAFTTDFEANNNIRIYANSTVTYLRRIVSIANNTQLTLDASIAVTNASCKFQKYFTSGTPLPITSVTIASNTSFTANLGLTIDSGSQTVYCTYPINRTLTSAIPKSINKSRFVKIDTSNNVANNVGPWDLGFTDVHKIRNVYIGSTYADTNPNRTTWFSLDTGQRDDQYDHGKLVVKPQYAASINATAKILVELDYFTANTSSSVGFFSVESYPVDDANTANTTAITTLELPTYNGKELRNYIDFRPLKHSTANASATSNTGATINPVVSNTTFNVAGVGQYTIAPDSNFTADFEYYLPRIDLLTLDSAGGFNVNKGVPASVPKTPFVENDQSVIAEIFVPAYPSATKREFDEYKSASSTRVNLKTNKRYTMKDIGALEERIKRSEYYIVLNMLEQQARDMTIPDVNGLDRFKNGIFADPFNSHNIGNVNDFEYKIAIDKDETVARPVIDKHDIDFTFVSSNSANVTKTGPVVTLPFDHEKHISQRFATKYRIPTESTWQWNGVIDLYPSYDFFRDEAVAPNVNVNIDIATPWEQFENSPFGMAYGDWRDISSSSSSSSSQSGDTITTTTTTSTTQERIINDINVDTFTEVYDLGSYVKDVSIQPYMRSRLIAFVSYNMKPNTTLHAFFDDVNVDAHCAPGVLSGVTEVQSGLEDRVVSRTSNFGTALVSDANGFVCGIFRIPEQTFRIGDRLFQLSNIDDIVTGASARITNGKAIFTAENIAVTKGSTTLNVRQPLLNFNSSNETRTETTQSTSVTVIPASGPSGDFSGGSCFVAGTKVAMTDGTTKNIEDVKIGDWVKGKFGPNKVLAYDSPLLNNPARTPTLYGINGSKPFVTAEHPFMTRGGWKSPDPEETKRLKPHLKYLNVGKLEVGDLIEILGGNHMKVETIEEYTDQPQQTVYNFVLEGDHTYYADNMLVHNRDPIAQSFSITNVPAQVSGLFVSQVGLYFRSKDSTLGCTVYICEMSDNGNPNWNRVVGKGYLASASINTSSTAATETVFNLEYPVYLLTDTDYAFIVEPDGYSPNYEIWVGETGNFDVVTEEQVFSNPYSGVMFVSANKRSWTPIQKEDIKFNLYRAKFTETSGTAVFKNEDDEYLTIDGFTRTNTAIGIDIGDVVYTVNSSLVTVNANNIASNTLTANTKPFGRIQYMDEANGAIWLDSSTLGGFSNTTNPMIAVYRVANPANTSLITANNLVAYGNIVLVENKAYHAIVPKFGTLQPAKTNLLYGYKGTTSAGNLTDSAYLTVDNNTETEFLDEERHVLSKSNELTAIAGAKSSAFQITLESSSDFVSPVINLSRKSMLFVENLINNDANNEHTRYGNAETKYVSKRLVLKDGQEAEDLKIFLTAYRPYETDIKLYAKFWNNQDPETFDSKVWTELQYTNDGNLVYSSPSNVRDYIEYEFNVPSINAVAMAAFANLTSNTYSPLLGTISIANNSTTITGTGTAFNTDFTVGDEIRVVSDTYFAIRTVTNIANSTVLTVDSGLQATNSAALYYVFDVGGNQGIVEYKNSANSRFIGFKEVAFKIVLLSSNPVKVPRLNDIRGICLQI